jgi:ubiquinone/menaquinone biosynthesis C-methylase UbiE
MDHFGFSGVFLDFVVSRQFAGRRLLEINQAGGLTPYLERCRSRTFAAYPKVDMMEMPYGDGAFDVVVHSDTLEHVPNPVRGLAECRRLLSVGGICAFTVPIVVGRQSRSRSGLRPSYHGSGEDPADYIVQTEYGADVWCQVIEAGFRNCTLHSLEYPAAIAIVAHG